MRSYSTTSLTRLHPLLDYIMDGSQLQDFQFLHAARALDPDCVAYLFPIRARPIGDVVEIFPLAASLPPRSPGYR